MPLPPLPADDMNNIQQNNEQFGSLVALQSLHGIVLPSTFSGAFEKHVFDNYLFRDGDIPKNYSITDLEFLQLKGHIETEYGS